MSDAIFGIAAAAMYIAFWVMCWLADSPSAARWLGDDDDDH